MTKYRKNMLIPKPIACAIIVKSVRFRSFNHSHEVLFLIWLVYSPHYDFGTRLINAFHPYDARKYTRAYRCIKKMIGSHKELRLIKPNKKVSRSTLELVHQVDYLDRDLQNQKYLSRALELPGLANLPLFILERTVLEPMRWAVSGTILASEKALIYGGAINLAGGFHHAASAHGHGFCVYADVAIAIQHLRKRAELSQNARIVHIDLDAHMGNGIARIFENDYNVSLFDMYNEHIFPSDRQAQKRIDWNIPLEHRTSSNDYLALLKSNLINFLESDRKPKLAFLNAGTDVFKKDPYGGLNLSYSAIIERDQFVIRTLNERSIPWVMLPSGGYSAESYRLLADSVISLVKP